MSSSLKYWLIYWRVWVFWLSALLINTISFVLISFQGSPAKTIVLKYSVVFGADVFGPAQELYKLPFIGFFVLFVNTLIYWGLKTRHRLLSEMALVVAILVAVILLTATVFLLFIN